MKNSLTALILLGVGLGACSNPGGDDEVGGTGTTEDSGEGDGDGEPDLPGSFSYQLFVAGPFDGDLVGAGMAADGASSANALCATERAASWSELPCETVSAILSSESSPLSLAALTLGLDPQGELLVAETGLSVGTVDAVFSGMMSMSLTDAGAFGGDTEAGLWTGSDNDGKYGLACSGWSTADIAQQGLTGDGSVADGWWSGGSITCSAQRRILCLCH